MYGDLKFFRPEILEESKLIRKAYEDYIELTINPEIEKISFKSVVEIRAFVIEASKRIRNKQPVLDLPVLARLKEFYDGAAYFIVLDDEDKEIEAGLLRDFRILVIQRLGKFVEALSKKSDVELKKEIDERNAAREAAKLAQERFKEKMQQREQKLLSTAQYDAISAINEWSDFGDESPVGSISFATKVEEAQLCIDCAHLQLDIHNFFNNCCVQEDASKPPRVIIYTEEVLRDQNKIFNKYFEIMQQHLRCDEKESLSFLPERIKDQLVTMQQYSAQSPALRRSYDVGVLQRTRALKLVMNSSDSVHILTEIKDIMHNLIGVFNGSILTLDRFARYSSHLQSMIVANPGELLDYISVLDEPSLFVYLQIKSWCCAVESILENYKGDCNPFNVFTKHSIAQLLKSEHKGDYYSLVAGYEGKEYCVKAFDLLTRIKKIYADLIVPANLTSKVLRDYALDQLEAYTALPKISELPSQHVDVIFTGNLERFLDLLKTSRISVAEVVKLKIEDFQGMLVAKERKSRLCM